MRFRRICQLDSLCVRKAPYDFIARDRKGNELQRKMCCFYHGIEKVNLNHLRGRPVYDCVVTPIYTYA